VILLAAKFSFSFFLQVIITAVVVAIFLIMSCEFVEPLLTVFSSDQTSGSAN